MQLSKRLDVTDKLILLYRNNQGVRQFARFCIVGVLATLIDMAIFYSMKLIVHYNIALVCGYCISLAFNYYMTVHWTFQTKSSARNLIGVVSAHMINLFVVRMGSMWILVNFFGLSSSLAFFPTIVISVLVNFILVKTFVK